LFITIFIFLVSIFYDNRYSWIKGQIELFLSTILTSLGAVGIGSWINSLTFLFKYSGLPVEAINLYLTAVPFTSGFQAAVSAMQISTLCFLITLACRRHLHTTILRVFKQACITIIPIILLFFGIKLYSPLPEIKSLKKSIYELSISSNINVTILENLEQRKDLIENEDTFDRILRTNNIRVGYIQDTVPFSFENYDHNLVGYDVAFAYELAYDLGCSLELVPINIANLTSDLNTNAIDIAMSGISVTEQRLKQISFTQTYMMPKYVFVTFEKVKKKFSSLEEIQSNLHLRIAVLKGSSYESVAHELFPDQKIIYLDSYSEFNPNIADGILWEEQQAISWSLGKQNIRVIFPSPSIGKDSVAYALNGSSPKFLNYLNQWLALKNSENFSTKQYDLWIDGKTEIAAPYEARWSIIRNVFHWID
jgi:ABC-type amino acid transport substrate-binding protein